MVLSRKLFKSVDDSRYSSNRCSEPVFYAAVEEDFTVGPVIEVFDGSDKVGAVVVLHKAVCKTLSKAFSKSMNT